MITTVLVLGLCAAAVQGVPFKRQLGICVEECSVVGIGFLSGCPHGQVCQSNGCGHTCQPVILGKRQFGICVEECSMAGIGFLSGCPNGQVCQSNGCGHTCQPVILGKRQFGACVEMCSPAGNGREDSCPAGTTCMSNGCGHTCQSVSLKGRSLIKPNCPMVLCALYCSNGFATGADGCPVCSCNSVGDLHNVLGTLG